MEASPVADAYSPAPSYGRSPIVDRDGYAADAVEPEAVGTPADAKVEHLLEQMRLQDPDWLLAHELGTVVAAILGFLDLLDAKGLLDHPEVLRAFLVSIRAQATDFASVLSELICLESRDGSPQTGQGRVARTKIPLPSTRTDE
jgi:signal transduction histidine kinase